MNSLCVIEFDGTNLWGTTVRIHADDRVEVVRRTGACASVAELGPVPRDCVVMSSEVAVALVRLPDGKRTADEMAALLRWELEPQLATRAQFDGEYVVGWSMQPGSGSACLAAAMGRDHRRRWRDDLSAARKRLLGIYPRLPAAAVKADALLEIEPFGAALSLFRDDSLESLQIVSDPAAARELIGTEPVVVCGRSAVALGERATLLDLPDAGITGVALHAAGRADAWRGVAVPARDPGAPLRLRPPVWWAAALVVLALSATGFLGLLDRSRHNAMVDLAQAREPWERVDREIRELRNRSDEAAILRQALAQLEGERDGLSARRGHLAGGPARRARFVTVILDALAKPAASEIVIDRVAEERPGRMLVEGRAVSERAVQIYTRAVAALVLPLGVHVVEPAARATDANYAFSFLLAETGGA